MSNRQDPAGVLTWFARCGNCGEEFVATGPYPQPLRGEDGIIHDLCPHLVSNCPKCGCLLNWGPADAER